MAEVGQQLTIFEIMRLASANAEYVHWAICPACHSCLVGAHSGASGQEFWCPTSGCNVGFKYNRNGDFECAVLCPAEWVGEEA